MLIKDKHNYIKNSEDVSSNSYIASHTASFLGKAYIATYMLNTVGRMLHPDHSQIIPSIVEDGNIDKLIFALGATIPYTSTLYLSKVSDKLKDSIYSLKYHATRNKVTDFMINNNNVNRAFSTFMTSFLGLLAWNQVAGSENLPIIPGNLADSGHRTPDMLHFSVGAGVGGYTSNPEDSIKDRIVKAISTATIFNLLWESFEQIGTKTGHLVSDVPGAMTSDWFQDIVNVYYGSGIGLVANGIKEKIQRAYKTTEQISFPTLDDLVKKSQ